MDDPKRRGCWPRVLPLSFGVSVVAAEGRVLTTDTRVLCV